MDYGHTITSDFIVPMLSLSGNRVIDLKSLDDTSGNFCNQVENSG